ncbi:hypothetical protein LX15_001184 [Streptoalloteichus tenebrarius]|uniref:Uncharacterized protein n=1 Tax=Streptoalloteichus tenebrarius (strain ATCC 17920 / DSM 40477 / JCM 4838 / CBS 697.72 / NBRC 16177 / NCIMB 11028 / NRRL B-12390 / A12253. 1 / ISP 5477) TaxID=1933 RepID=A0ABT1HPP9_STRSD|nr:DUF6492 family protein [Streptoalloteichus tenebrarius]MCP2257499.1 hypothetical protein [Streptoalloteichus tenebrarius]BFE98449.1 hypothetical protein GCM10020241_01250 [Streptoalloteichus tenebrarius]
MPAPATVTTGATVPDLPPVAVLVLAASKDLPGLGVCLSSILRHCRNPVSALHVVAQRFPHTPPVQDPRIIWIDERRCVPSTAEINAALLDTGRDPGNASWYFQQLVKLRCFDLLPQNTPDHVLVVDSDMALLRDTTFVDTRRRSLLPYGYPLYWRPGTRHHQLPPRHSALDAARRLVPGWRPLDPYSGMHHHMVFDRAILNDLTQRVRHAHPGPFWRAFLATANTEKWTGASEYVLYRHFAGQRFPHLVRHRHLRTVEIIQADEPSGFTLPELVEAARRTPLDAVGCHRFLHYTERLATMDYIPEALRESGTVRPVPLRLRLDHGLLTIDHAARPLTL